MAQCACAAYYSAQELVYERRLHAKMAQDSPVGSKRHHEDISLGCGEGKSKFERTHAREHAVHICTGAYKPALAASTIDEKADMKGPISTSNWVIPGRLIAGSYPGSKESDAQHRDTISSIIDAGIYYILISRNVSAMPCLCLVRSDGNSVSNARGRTG